MHTTTTQVEDRPLVGVLMFALPLAVFSGGSAFAQSDCAGLDGQLGSLCERYCEKKQCDESNPERDECQRLRLTFEKKAGSSTFPCDPEVPLPTSGCEALTGQPRRLCERYCIKRDCDVVESRHCHRLRITFERKTGSEIFPCDLPPPVPTLTPTPRDRHRRRLRVSSRRRRPRRARQSNRPSSTDRRADRRARRSSPPSSLRSSRRSSPRRADRRADGRGTTDGRAHG